MNIGYQLYSARDFAEKDLIGTLKQLKAMGYQAIETAGLYNYSVKEFKAALDEAGLIAISAHIPVDTFRNDMFGTIATYKELCVKYIAIAYTDENCRPGGPDFANVLREMAKFGRLCREAGMQLLYHNHDFEFTRISGVYGLDFIYSAIDAETLQTEIDTCWVKYAGLNPAEYVLSYKGRAPIVHLKDFVGKKGTKNPYALIGKEDDSASPDEIEFEFRPVGHGCQDIPSILQAGTEAGAQWFIVEQDLSIGRTSLEAAQLSIDYLKNL